MEGITDSKLLYAYSEKVNKLQRQLDKAIEALMNQEQDGVICPRNVGLTEVRCATYKNCKGCWLKALEEV